MIDLRLGDCLEVLKTLEDNSVDSIVTDPPYGIGFMNKEWDSPQKHKELIDRENKRSQERFEEGKSPVKGGFSKGVQPGLPIGGAKEGRWFQEWCELWAQECFRVLKPGGHILSFSAPRTYHRMATAFEDSGFQIRDQIMWVFGSGFPKSRNIGKDVDKMRIDNDWEGWGTALKPAHEPICMARKPLTEKSIAENVLKHGTGGINIDDSRIEFEDTANEQGRFPANIIFDEEAGKILDEQSGVSKSSPRVAPKESIKDPSSYNTGVGGNSNLNDKGGASRFFYCPKVSKKERNAGLEDFEAKTNRQKGHGLDRICGNCGTSMLKPKDCKCETPDWITPPKKNTHPTVKPIKLMEYLITLVTPKGGIVLEPFMGSGSTGIAAKNLGMSFIGIEKEEEYFEIAKQRINGN
jgi:site-specific DNA-methyltransferase (adenine-specific)